MEEEERGVTLIKLKRDVQRNGAVSVSREPHEENDWVL